MNDIGVKKLPCASLYCAIAVASSAKLRFVVGSPLGKRVVSGPRWVHVNDAAS